MKLVRKVVWENIPPLEYFQKEHDWDVNSMEEVADLLDDWALDELYVTFGWYPKYTTEIVEEKQTKVYFLHRTIRCITSNINS